MHKHGALVMRALDSNIGYKIVFLPNLRKPWLFRGLIVLHMHQHLQYR